MKERIVKTIPAEYARAFEVVKDAQQRSYSPYSKFPVGCMVIDENGETFIGCNVENVSYAATMCAERVALGNMITYGGRKCQLVMIVTPSNEPKMPCGICLQAIREFGDDVLVVSANNDGTDFIVTNIKKLYPKSFSELT